MRELFKLFNRKNIFAIYACKSELGYTRKIERFNKGVRFSELEGYVKEHKNNAIMFLFEGETSEMFFN